MTRRRTPRRGSLRRPRATDLEHAPETDAVRLPLDQEADRGERLAQTGEREPGALKKRSQDAVGEGNVTELARDLDDESVRTLEKNSAKSQPRAAPHRHRSRP